MRLGLDFDNTLVSYDALFHKVAREGGWIPADLPASKVRVRDHLRQIGREDVWTEMQGYVYGARMGEALPYAGVLDFLRWARAAGLTSFIVSHKTRHPYLGPKYDLHEAARKWVSGTLSDADGPLVDPERVYFEQTKQDKIARIAQVGCTVFIDDLPEILEASDFPAGTEPVLFDPEDNHPTSRSTRARDWNELRVLLKCRWKQEH